MTDKLFKTDVSAVVVIIPPIDFISFPKKPDLVNPGLMDNHQDPRKSLSWSAYTWNLLDLSDTDTFWI